VAILTGKDNSQGSRINAISWFGVFSSYRMWMMLVLDVTMCDPLSDPSYQLAPIIIW